eukprot:1156736-Pelagomonas_calceolata.AAC.3
MGREPLGCWLLVKFTPGYPGSHMAPPALKLGMQAKHLLSRMWPAWPAQCTPCPETQHASQTKTGIGGFEFG